MLHPLLCRNISARHFIAFILLLSISSCEKNLDQPIQTQDSAFSALRKGTLPIFSVSYEVETYSRSTITNERSNQLISEFRKIASQPVIERKVVDFQVFDDGAYEMTTTSLKPRKPEMMGAPRQKVMESIPLHKTVNRNGTVHYYDENGKEAGKYNLKSSPYKTIIDQIRRDRPTGETAEEIGRRIVGNPLIEKESILKSAQELGAEIKDENGFTKISYDMERLAGSLNEETKSYIGKVAHQYYDFNNNRLLMATIYDSSLGKLISKSVITYTPIDRGNHIVKISSEHIEVDTEVGEEVTKIVDEYFSEMKVNANL